MEEKNNQTRKSLIVVGVLIAIISISAITPAKWLGVKPKKEEYKELDLTVVTSPSQTIKDKNKDGIVTWSEIIDETLKDSTTTLAKINKTPIDQKVIDELNDPNNLTSSFSKNMYLATAYFKENGITDEKIQQETINKLINEEAKKITTTTYTLTDINIAKTETKESIKAYGNAIAPLVKDLISSEIITKDLVSISSFVKTKDEKMLLPLTKNKDRLDVSLSKLLTIQVPSSAMATHILILNRTVLYRDTLDNLSKASPDPVRARLSIDNHQKSTLLLLKLPNNLSTFFSSQNIIFSNNEAGYIFTTGFIYK